MFRDFLVPEITIREQGAGEPIHCGLLPAALVTLGIISVEEQESLHISLWQSPDGTNWGTKPFAQFAQKFYTGTHQMVVTPAAQWLQARWHVNRWGRGDMTPRFTFYVFIELLP